MKDYKHIYNFEQFYLLVYNITPCSPLEVNRRFGGTYRLHLHCRKLSQAERATCFTLLFFLAYSSTLKTVATYSSKTSVDFQRTTWGYIPEDRSLWGSQTLHICNFVSDIFCALKITSTADRNLLWLHRTFGLCTKNYFELRFSQRWLRRVVQISLPSNGPRTDPKGNAPAA
jgi:hypothetical protein